jgi:hypothetical protein
MRRSIQTRFVTGCLQDGGQHMAGTAFPVSAGDMNAFELVLGITQCLTQVDSVGEILFKGNRTYTAEHG